ncbi:MAG TPA: histidine kinase [Actinomycetota bacterium]|nr:histidine kinase [Actinomycetota bacterium]
MAARAGGMKQRWAAALCVVAVTEVLVAIALVIAVGWSWDDALESFVATNGVMGLAFGLSGGIIAWHRPKNAVGWLLIADGLAHATAAWASPAVKALHDAGGPIGAQRILLTVFMYSWPWAIGLFLPLVLLLFPDGRPISRRWRWVVRGVIATAPLFVLEMGAGNEPIHPSLPTGYLTLPWHERLQALWVFSEVRTFGALILGIVAVVVRFRRGTSTERRRLLWLVLAAILAVALALPWGFIAGTPVVVLFAIPLIPAGITIGIVRYQLLDIQLVVSRAVTWLMLSACVFLGYIALVAALDRFVSERVGRSAVATVLIALLVAPILPRLQRSVDRGLYGRRGDPADVASRVGQELLAGVDAGLSGVAAAVREALRLPYAAISTSQGVLAEDGTQVTEVRTIPLEYAGERVGDLLVGTRRGELDLGAADRHVLTLLAVPLAVAVHADALSAQLQTSRERLVAAREEERRRLRRDLHDGLGPTLTGVALTADAAENLLLTEPNRARELVGALRRDIRIAIGDVRRVVDDLRPSALDDLGLVGALRQRADQLTWRGEAAPLRIDFEVPGQIPRLPAAIEVAAYRVGTEALTNVARHAGASAAVIRFSCDDQLHLEITDDGCTNGKWTAGVGLEAMRERVGELGGRFEAGPTDSGGRVRASFPLYAG